MAGTWLSSNNIKSFPIFSPQGDGNLDEASLIAHGDKCLFLSFPRKGTETELQPDLTAESFGGRLFLSFPRKGTETSG